MHLLQHSLRDYYKFSFHIAIVLGKIICHFLCFFFTSNNTAFSRIRQYPGLISAGLVGFCYKEHICLMFQDNYSRTTQWHFLEFPWSDDLDEWNNRTDVGQSVLTCNEFENWLPNWIRFSQLLLTMDWELTWVATSSRDKDQTAASDPHNRLNIARIPTTERMCVCVIQR